MKLWKSLLVGFGTYVVLTFVTNILTYTLASLLPEYFALGFWRIFVSCFTGVEGFNPVSVDIYNGMIYAINTLPIGTTVAYLQGIGAVLRPIFPGLTAAILAGKIGKTSSNGFFAMLITGVLVSVVPIVVLFIDPVAVSYYIPTVLAVVTSPWLIATFIGVIGALIGLFWGGLAAWFGRE